MRTSYGSVFGLALLAMSCGSKKSGNGSLEGRLVFHDSAAEPLPVEGYTIEVDGPQLQAYFLDKRGETRDHFTMRKE